MVLHVDPELTSLEKLPSLYSALNCMKLSLVSNYFGVSIGSYPARPIVSCHVEATVQTSSFLFFSGHILLREASDLGQVVLLVVLNPILQNDLSLAVPAVCVHICHVFAVDP